MSFTKPTLSLLFSLLLISSTVVNVLGAPPTIPLSKCANQCLTAAVQATGCSNTKDINCLCSSPAYSQIIAQCPCTVQDLADVQVFENDQCAALTSSLAAASGTPGTSIGTTTSSTPTPTPTPNSTSPTPTLTPTNSPSSPSSTPHANGASALSTSAMERIYVLPSLLLLLSVTSLLG